LPGRYASEAQCLKEAQGYASGHCNVSKHGY
jgi:hypothetical protein